MAKFKKAHKFYSTMLWIFGFISLIALGGLFLNGTFLNTLILGWFPLIIHQIIGWSLIVTAIVGVLLAISKKM